MRSLQRMLGAALLAAALGASLASASSYRFTTLKLSAPLSRPSGLAIDYSGALYVADVGNQTVVKIVPGTGQVTTLAGVSGVAGTALTQFNFNSGELNGIAVDGTGTVYVDDNTCIRKIAFGSVSNYAGRDQTGTTLASPPSDAIVGSNGDTLGPIGGLFFFNNTLYCSDANYGLVRTISNDLLTTVAGNPNAVATAEADGAGPAARFVRPAGITVDNSSNMFVADQTTVRMVTPQHAVTTVAGSAASGFADGTGSAAKFGWLAGIALLPAAGPSGNTIVVADRSSGCLRSVTAGGVVTTLAGTAGAGEHKDGLGASAHFIQPTGIVTDSLGNIYVTDMAAGTVSFGTPYSLPQAFDVQGSTAAGQPVSVPLIADSYLGASLTYAIASQTNGTAVINGNVLTFTPAAGFTGLATVTYTVTDPEGAVSNAANVEILVGGVVITVPVRNTVALAGQATALDVGAAGSGLTYQWAWNGVPLADGPNVTGSTSSRLDFANPGAANAGTYTVVVTNSTGSQTSSSATLTVVSDARLLNLSASANVGANANAMTVGFVVGGSGSKPVLIRGIGPTLGAFGVAGALSQPQLSVYNSGSAQIDSGAAWGGSPALVQVFNQVSAFPLPTSSADAALLENLTAGSYSVVLAGLNQQTGVALEEAYDAGNSTNTAARLANISARANVGMGGAPLSAGFAVAGTQSESVLIRGVGPTLASFGVPGPLPAAVLSLYDSQNQLVATNSGWTKAATLGNSTVRAAMFQPTVISSIESSVSAFALLPNSADAAMVATLPPGTYTVQLTGVGGATGVGLVEIYEVK